MRATDFSVRALGALVVLTALGVLGALALQQAPPSHGEDETPRVGSAGMAQPVMVDPRHAERAHAPVPAPPEPTMRSFAGTIVLYDAQGQTVDVEHGELVLDLSWSTESQRKKVGFHHGTWELTCAWEVSARIEEIRSGRLRARARRPDLILGHDQNFAIEADVLYDGILRVVDAGSGLDLPDVSVLLPQRGQSHVRYPSLDLQRVPALREASSPIPMPEAEGQNDVWIGATGFAWKRISYGAGPGQPVVPLSPAGVLRVEFLQPGESWLEPWLEVVPRDPEARDASAPNWVAQERLHDSRSTMTLTGFPTGSYVARWIGRPALGPEVVFGESEFRIDASTTTDLTFDASEYFDRVRPGRLTVSVSDVPPAYVSGLRVSIEGIDPPSIGRGSPSSLPLADLADDSGAGTYEASISHLVPGKYRLGIIPGGVTREILLEPGGDDYVQLRVPELAIVRLWTVDGQSGDRVHFESAFWRPHGIAAAPWKQATLVAADLLVEPGAIDLAVRARGYATKLVETEAVPGLVEVLVEFEPGPRGGIELAVISAGIGTPVSPDFWRSIRVLDSAGQSAFRGVKLTGQAGGTAAEVSVATVLVDGPGEYELQFPELPEYHPLENLRVSLTDSRARWDLQLRRR